LLTDAPVATAAFTVRCPAKLNLFLEVLGKRPDGYHDVETLMVPLTGLVDRIDLRLAPKGTLALVVTAPDAWGVPPGEGNLVHRAAKMLLEEGKAEFGLSLHLHKRIPPGAGLGGGSSDAAGLLRALHRLLDLRVPWKRLQEIGLSLGSDVPFFLEKPGAAVARGRGEVLEIVAGARPRNFLLAWPGVPASTAEVYARCTPREPGGRREIGPVLEALRKGEAEALGKACFNRLAAPAREVCPAVADAIVRLEALGFGPARMTGSGSACFVVLPVDGGRRPDLARLIEGWGPGAWAVEA
jgi:4-diphosphocytidyl-2-C-methyl-D-erythritol kinase